MEDLTFELTTLLESSVSLLHSLDVGLRLASIVHQGAGSNGERGCQVQHIAVVSIKAFNLARSVNDSGHAAWQNRVDGPRLHAVASQSVQQDRISSELKYSRLQANQLCRFSTGWSSTVGCEIQRIFEQNKLPRQVQALHVPSTLESKVHRSAAFGALWLERSEVRCCIIGKTN